MFKSDLVDKIDANNQKQLQLDNKNKKLIKQLRNKESSNVATSDGSNNHSDNAISRHTVKSSALDKTVNMTHKANKSNANSILSQIGMSNPSNYKPKDIKHNYHKNNRLHVHKHGRNTGLNPQNNPFLNPNAFTPKSSGGTPHVE